MLPLSLTGFFQDAARGLMPQVCFQEQENAVKCLFFLPCWIVGLDLGSFLQIMRTGVKVTFLKMMECPVCIVTVLLYL